MNKILIFLLDNNLTFPPTPRCCRQKTEKVKSDWWQKKQLHTTKMGKIMWQQQKRRTYKKGYFSAKSVESSFATETHITFKVFTNRIKGSMIDEDASIVTGDSLKLHQWRINEGSLSIVTTVAWQSVVEWQVEASFKARSVHTNATRVTMGSSKLGHHMMRTVHLREKKFSCLVSYSSSSDLKKHLSSNPEHQKCHAKFKNLCRRCG